MKRCIMAVLVVGLILVIVPGSMGFYAWIPFASWGHASSSSGSSSGFYPASSSSSGW